MKPIQKHAPCMRPRDFRYTAAFLSTNVTPTLPSTQHHSRWQDPLTPYLHAEAAEFQKSKLTFSGYMQTVHDKSQRAASPKPPYFPLFSLTCCRSPTTAIHYLWLHRSRASRKTDGLLPKTGLLFLPSHHPRHTHNSRHLGLLSSL